MIWAIIAGGLLISLAIGFYLGQSSMQCWKREAVSKREIRGLPDMPGNLISPPLMKPPKLSSKAKQTFSETELPHGIGELTEKELEEAREDIVHSEVFALIPKGAQSLRLIGPKKALQDFLNTPGVCVHMITAVTAEDVVFEVESVQPTDPMCELCGLVMRITNAQLLSMPPQDVYRCDNCGTETSVKRK